MEFFNQNEQKVTIPDDVLNQPVNNSHGKCGTVYHYKEGKCLKIYNREVTNKFYWLHPKILKRLQNTGSKNLVEIDELFFKDKKDIPFTADAYTMTFYKEYYNDFMDLPTDYLIENIESILKFGKDCAENHIRLHDLKRDNSIFTKERIILCDPDHHQDISFPGESELAKVNYSCISAYFANLTEEALKNKKYHDFLLENNLYRDYIAYSLFPITTNPKKAMRTITKRLNGHETVEDYGYSLKKKKKYF